MEDLRNHFPALASRTYLNTASNGLMAKPVVDWRREHDLNLLNGASEFRDQHKKHIIEIRQTVSNYFGASENDTALVPNFSFGLNVVLEGLPKGQKILLLKNDYPSVNWPVETRDFNVCYAEINENLEKNIEEAVNKHRPDVFMLSVVQWLSGIKIDFEFLKQLKGYHPNLLIIADGTQFLGTEKFNFSESPIDILGGSTYKWLLGGYGNGLFMVKEEAKGRVFPSTIGFNSAERFESSATETTFIKHFEPGHQDTLNYGTLEQAILFAKQIGTEDIFEKISNLSKLAKDRFSEMGLLNEDTLNRKEHSSIYNLKGDKALFQKLKENNIICSLRGGGIRVSFHFYNSEDDLDKLCSVYKKFR